MYKKRQDTKYEDHPISLSHNSHLKKSRVEKCHNQKCSIKVYILNFNFSFFYVLRV
jgi:hypothetical protein